MLAITQLAGFGASGAVVSYAGKDAFEIATALNINSGCWMCLDAGDSTSYSSGQTWTDLSGASCNFYRGSSSSSQSSDPTFNGTPGGLSANEYWSFDGGDFFTKTSSNSTAITNLHKAGASYTLIAVLMLPGTASEQCIFATNNNLGTKTGIIWKKASTDLARSYASNGSSAFAAASPDAVFDTGWTVVSVNIDAASGVGFFTRMRSYDPVSSANTFNATYSSPSTGNAGFTAQIFASGNSSDIALSGSRLAIIAGFSPVLTFNKVAEYAGALAQRFRI